MTSSTLVPLCPTCLQPFVRTLLYQVNLRSEHQRLERLPEEEVTRIRLVCLRCLREYDEDDE